MLRKIWEYAFIKRSTLFDPRYYLFTYPDVRIADIDPLWHYVKIGWKEGRSPSENFDLSHYISINEGMGTPSVNPLVYYLKNRKKIGGESISPLPEVQKNKSPQNKKVYLLNKATRILEEEGIGSLLKKGKKKLLGARTLQEEIRGSLESVDYVISIIIPAYNAVEYTKACIEKTYLVGSKHRFEVIVVDNASQDATNAEMLNEEKVREDFHYFRLEENLGFAGGVNFGLRKAHGRFLVILNNDTLPTEGWLDHMVDAFEQSPFLGIVSPMTNYVGEGPQLDLDAIDIQPDQIDAYAKTISNRDVYLEPGRLVFFCVMIRKSVVDQIGLLDEGYIKGNFEDDDYCLRTILSGYQLAIAKNAFVYHHGSVTFKENKITHSEYMEINRKRFFLKAGNLATTPRDFFGRSGKQAISVIVRTLNRQHLLLKALASLSNQNFNNFEVVLVNDGGEDVQAIVNDFSKYFPINYVFHQKSKGRTQALNAGVNHASAEWITFLDDDDIVYPWHLATLYKNTTLENAEKMFYSNYNRTLFLTQQSDTPAVLMGVEPWPYQKETLWVSNHIPIHTWLISKQCFEKVGYFDENQNMLEDFEFLVRLSKYYDFRHVNRVTSEYRYYLDGMNSMINQRERTYEALQYIYNRHEAYNKSIAQSRDLELQALSRQIGQINELKQQLNGNQEHDTKVIRRITQIILGF